MDPADATSQVLRLACGRLSNVSPPVPSSSLGSEGVVILRFCDTMTFWMFLAACCALRFCRLVLAASGADCPDGLGRTSYGWYDE
eukprot:1178948-Prorocentrum_minimum.AAC.4